MTSKEREVIIKRLAMIFNEIDEHPLKPEAFSHHEVYCYLEGLGLKPILDPSAGDGKWLWTVAENKFSAPIFSAKDVAQVFVDFRGGDIPYSIDDCSAVHAAIKAGREADIKTEPCEKSIYDEALQRQPKEVPSELPTATDILSQVAKVMEDRAAQYDQKETGERSMQSAIEAFNAIKQTSLTAADGFLLLALLKAVRANTAVREDAILDSLHDGVAYFSLHGEAMMADKRSQGLL